MSMSVANGKLRIGNRNADYVQSPNVGGTLDPRFVIIHYTASGPNSNIAQYFSKSSAKVSAHLVIRRDGTIIQCVPFDTVAWHAGKSSWIGQNGKKYSGLNQNSIGIEIENWGPLKRTEAGWSSWTGASVDSSKVMRARHKFGTPNGGWEIFTEAQVEATLEATQAICEAYKIEDVMGHDDISPGRKSDPGPAWAMASFKARIFGRADEENGAMVVRSPTGLNIRTGAGANEPTVRNEPLPDGTRVLVHEAQGRWRFVSVIDANGQPDYSGWVHGGFLFDA